MASKVIITPSRASKKETQSVSLTFENVSFSPCNYIALLDHDERYPDFYNIADFLLKCPLYKALTYSPKMSKFLLGNFWATCVYNNTTKEVRASVLSTNDVSFNVEDVRRVLDLPTYSPYEELASIDDLDMVVTVMGYVQDPSVKSQGTLYRKCMGGVWNFLFSHLIHCLSSKIGGMDQSPNSITQLAHALIFQKKIDFAEYFFEEFVKKMDSFKSSKVPFVRFFSMLIADKLGTRMPADVDNYYDLKVSQIGLQILKKASLPTDLPLPSSMVSFANSPNPVWGAFLVSTTARVRPHVARVTKNAFKSAGPLSLSATCSKKATSLAKNKLADSEATTSKEPSESHSASKTSKIKRKHSQLSHLGSSSEKAKKPKKAKNASLVKDSQQFKVVEISPAELRASAMPPPSYFMPSQKDTVVHLGIPHQSASAFLHDHSDDSDTSSFRGPSSPPHARDLSPEIDNLDDIACVNDTSTTTMMVIDDQPLADVDDTDIEPHTDVADTDIEPHADVADTNVQSQADVGYIPIRDSQDADGTVSVVIHSPDRSTSPDWARSPNPSTHRSFSDLSTVKHIVSSSSPPHPGFWVTATFPLEILYALPHEVVKMFSDITTHSRMLGSQQATLHADFSSKFDTLAAKATYIKEKQDADYCATYNHTCTLRKLEERIDGFSTTLSRTNELLADFATNVFKDIKSHNDMADVRVSAVTSAITDLSAKISDTFVSNSEIHKSSLDDLSVRVTAISDTQSTILKSLADLRSRSDTQSEVNQTILRSLADLHAKVDSQTHVSKMVLERTPTKFSFDLGTSQFTESDRVLLNQVSQRVQDHHLLLGGIQNNVSRLFGANSASIPTVHIEREKSVVHDSNNGETSSSDDHSSGNDDALVDHDAPFEGEQLISQSNVLSQPIVPVDGEQQPVVSSHKQPVAITSTFGEMDAPTHREGKAPMTPNEEVIKAKIVRIAKDEAKSVALEKQFDESNKSQFLVKQLAERTDPLKMNDDQLKKEKRIKWYNDTIIRRYIATTITSTQIKGPQKLTYDSDQVFLVIGRANGMVRTEKLSWMHAYGVSEWIETIEFIKKSRSTYREYVLSHFDQLMKKILIIKNHYKLSSPPQLSFLKKLPIQ